MQLLNEHLRVEKKCFAISKFVMSDFEEFNNTKTKILEKHKSDFFKNSRANNVNNTSTNRSPLQLHLVNLVSNIRDDPRDNNDLYA
jgi:hypothetical protein